MRDLGESRYKTSQAYFRLLQFRLQASTKRTHTRDTMPFWNGTPLSQVSTIWTLDICSRPWSWHRCPEFYWRTLQILSQSLRIISSQNEKIIQKHAFLPFLRKWEINERERSSEIIYWPQQPCLRTKQILHGQIPLRHPHPFCPFSLSCLSSCSPSWFWSCLRMEQHEYHSHSVPTLSYVELLNAFFLLPT